MTQIRLIMCFFKQPPINYVRINIINKIKFSLLLVAVIFIQGCATNMPLNSAKAEHITATKLIVVKLQNNLKYEKYIPIAVYSPDLPLAIALNLLLNGSDLYFMNKEQKAFEEISKDLESYSLENDLSKSLDGVIDNNKHFKFTSKEVISIRNNKDIINLFYNDDAKHIAFLFTEYNLNRKMTRLSIKARLELYEKPNVSKSLNKLPRPIYQTNAKFKYKLPHANIFVHTDNAKRWNKDNSKLMLIAMNEGASKISSDLIVKLSDPIG